MQNTHTKLDVIKQLFTNFKGHCYFSCRNYSLISQSVSKFRNTNIFFFFFPAKDSCLSKQIFFFANKLMQYNAALAQKAAEKAFMYSNQVLTCHALVKQQLYSERGFTSAASPASPRRKPCFILKRQTQRSLVIT